MDGLWRTGFFEKVDLKKHCPEYLQQTDIIELNEKKH